MSSNIRTDLLVIGSGISGLVFALEVVERSSLKVTIITKLDIMESNTKYAQGGIASVSSDVDSLEKHVKDTLIAGAGLCRMDRVENILKQGPAVIEKLEKLGVNFDRINEKLSLGKEGGHSQRRIAHVADQTGLVISNALVNAVEEHNQITVYEKHIAIDLVIINGQVAGAYILDRSTSDVKNFSSKMTVLAAGGVGKVFLYTSNPDIASGDGVAMGYRIGATIANMEFVQFHPTIYYNPNLRSFLITEAMRGEGAILKNKSGEQFMQNKHPLEELAPRDIVARQIDLELKKTGDDYVFLDISHKNSLFVKERFPTIYSTLIGHGLDITKDPIPIVPAAHYTIGGIRTDIKGQTDINGLLAIGENAYTGLHGANRLASNSLLEGGVVAMEAAVHAINQIKDKSFQCYEFPPWESGDAVSSDEAVIVSHNWDEVRRLMWSYVGIVRTTKRLLRAKKRINLLKDEINEYYWEFHVTPDIIELRNLVHVAELIIESALFRKESRGAHFTQDYPNPGKQARDTLVQKKLGVFASEIIND